MGIKKIVTFSAISETSGDMLISQKNQALNRGMKLGALQHYTISHWHKN